MYTKLSIALTSALALVASALPRRSDIASVTFEARDRTNFRVCGSRSSPVALFSLSDQSPTLRGQRTNRILLKSQGQRANDGVTLALFEPLTGHTRCQLNFVLPQSSFVQSNFAGQLQSTTNFRFTDKVRVDVLQVPRPAAAGQQNFSPSWSNLGAQDLPVWGTFSFAAPGVQVVNVADCSKSSAFLMRVSRDSQARDFVFDQQNQVGDDQSTSLGLFMSFDC